MDNNPITGAGQPQPQPQPQQPEPQPQPQQPQPQPQPAVQATPQPTAQSQPTTTNDNIISNPQSTAYVPNATTSPAPSPIKPKGNGKLIAIIIALAAVIIAIVVTLVIVLVSNSSKPSNNRNDNTGNNHYETNDDDNNDKDNTPPSTTGSSISCLGYSFNKLDGYNYDCQISDLTVQNVEFATILETMDGISYYQAEGQADALAGAFENAGVNIRSHRSYTASTGKKMLIFDASHEGTNIYIYMTAASNSSILAGQLAKRSGSPTNSDLEIVASILGASTVASRLPEENPEDANKELPTIDWKQYLKVPEFTE